MRQQGCATRLPLTMRKAARSNQNSHSNQPVTSGSYSIADYLPKTPQPNPINDPLGMNKKINPKTLPSYTEALGLTGKAGTKPSSSIKTNGNKVIKLNESKRSEKPVIPVQSHKPSKETQCQRLHINPNQSPDNYNDWNPFTWDYRFNKQDYNDIADGIDHIADKEIEYGKDLTPIGMLGGYNTQTHVPGIKTRMVLPDGARVRVKFKPKIGNVGGTVTAIGGGMMAGGAGAKGVAWLMRQIANRK